MKSLTRLLAFILVLSTTGSACLDFDKAQARFCVNASPAQQREVCSISQAAIRVSVFYSSYEPACIRVTASDVNGKQESADIQRQEFLKSEQRKVIIAVGSKEKWPRQMAVKVASYDASAGVTCGGNLLESYVSNPITVPPGRFGTFDVTLQAQDEDNDGHILRTESVAGTDCDDENPNVHPNAQEACGATADYNCDGRAGCANSECMNQACDDGNACTLEDRCVPDAGSALKCRGTPKQCEPPNLECYTSETACVPSTGECVITHEPASKACDDHNACTTSDECAPDAVCQGVPTVQCNTPPNTTCYERVGACIPTTGQCSYMPKPQTAVCDDGDACTANHCDGRGSCLSTTLSTCVPSNVCYRSERLDCPRSAACTETADPSKVNTSCRVNGRSGVCRQGDGLCSSFPFIPSNFDPDTIAEAERSLEIRISCGSPADPVIFNSTSLTWTSPANCTLPAMPVARVMIQGNAEIAVLPMRSLLVEAGRALKLRGHRPVILAVYGDASLSGALLADADREVPGAGGNRADCGPQRGMDGLFSDDNGSGGGGGGFGQIGVPGGKNSTDAAGGSGGLARNPTLSPLVGGCAGGTGGTAPSRPSGGLGGAGGGAVQVAVAGTLRVEHWISVSGGGGGGGRSDSISANSSGGGGGGSGGGLLLEAFALHIFSPARFTANGGGGGEGGGPVSGGFDGADGTQDSRNPAAGGSGIRSLGGDGGEGGADGAQAEAGADGDPNYHASGGGGGGGVGVIQMRGFGTCSIDSSCNNTDGNGCDISPRVNPICP